MEYAADGTAIVAIVLLGLSAGALLAEGAVLVPFWRSLQPDLFLDWYRANASLLLRFFGPLEVATVLFAIVAALIDGFSRGSANAALVVSAALSTAVLLAFPLYFQRANASFAEGTIPEDRVPEELGRWAAWHWARVGLASAAFLAACLSRFTG